ncbi:Uncharacterised protein [Streptococcus pneumoniae]|nr:Uncharacterised protein [Streptococcus pneumoniae]
MPYIIFEGFISFNSLYEIPSTLGLYDNFVNKETIINVATPSNIKPKVLKWSSVPQTFLLTRALAIEIK